MLRGALTLMLLALTLPAASPASKPEPRMLGPFGNGADAYWLWKAQGTPKAVVVFEHGLDESELNPATHRPWLWHLAREGDAVVYPRYEAVPGAFGANRHIEFTVERAL